MKNTAFLSALFLLCLSPAMAQHSFFYKNRKLTTSGNTFFVDGKLKAEALPAESFVFASLPEALRAAERQSERCGKKTIDIYIAPGVYWIDNPDDPEVRRPLPGENIPYGMKLKVSNLRLTGLSEKAEEVVVACNRGQTQGAAGNFTMFHIEGNDIHTEHITFGNYCNVDLIYPLDERLNRKKRSETIAQAQLIICKGDRVVARNCRFISRLNSCPFAGAKRAWFDNCYFECTDDALCGTGVYHHCRFTFFSGKPFYATQGTGAVFLNCDIHSLTQGKQYLVKSGSPVSMVDCRWTSEDPALFIGWTQDPTDDLRSYQYNLTLNGKPLFINADRPWLTVDMNGKDVLDAYRLQMPKELSAPACGDADSIVYNLYNLLRGNDDWDPASQQDIIREIYRKRGKHEPVTAGKAIRLVLSHRTAEIETERDSLHIRAHCLRMGSVKDSDEKTVKEPIRWSVAPQDSAYVTLCTNQDGSCVVKPENNEEEARTIVLLAHTDTGLEAACVLTVKPRTLEAPAFIGSPSLRLLTADREGERLAVEYQLDLQGRADRSLITWYRCTDATGGNAIPVAVSRLNVPERTYTLSPADNGYYIKVSVAPAHLRSLTGKAESVVTSLPVRLVQTNEKETSETPSTGSRQSLHTDFRNFPTDHQPLVIPGFWTVDAFKPEDTNEFDWTPRPLRSWEYGKGVDGASEHMGLLQTQRGARLLYTPVEGTYRDMEVNLIADPCKTAGQGFGSATGQYMDIYIKFDTRTLTGYALRIIRTTKHDKAVNFMLMRYEKGIATPITAPISSICYRTGCEIRLHISGNRFTARARTSTPLPEPHRPDLRKEVALEATIADNPFGGTGIQHTGSVGASATLLRNLTVVWE